LPLKPCRELINHKRLPRMVAAMTIGTGYFSGSKIVLGSDMELTAIAKYRGVKDYFKWFDGEEGIIGAVYSGLEDDLRNVWEKITEEIRKQGNSILGVAGVRRILSNSLAVVTKRNFRMLVGITKGGETPLYLRVAYKTVSPGHMWEFIGGGDVELTRYLAGLMTHPSLTTEQAVLWSIYIITAASSYVQGVGQGIRISVVEDGRVHYFNGEVYADKLLTFESYVAGLWFDLFSQNLSKEEYDRRLDAFVVGARAIKDKLPRQF
jgi:hypothetical protein